MASTRRATSLNSLRARCGGATVLAKAHAGHMLAGNLALIAAFAFLLPLYVMLVTSFKSMPEVHEAHIFNFPREWTIDPWINLFAHPAYGLGFVAAAVAALAMRRISCRFLKLAQRP